MMPNDTSSSTAMTSAADALAERQNPSDVDRLREVVGADVLPDYHDVQADAASLAALARWPHLAVYTQARDSLEPAGD